MHKVVPPIWFSCLPKTAPLSLQGSSTSSTSPRPVNITYTMSSRHLASYLGKALTVHA